MGLCVGERDCSAGRLLPKTDSGLASLPADRQLTWTDVAGLFPAPQECLAAYIAVAAAEVLSGAKPANLISIRDRMLPCGRRMYHLWQEFGAEVLQESPLSVKSMRTGNGGVLLLLYRTDLLEKRLSGRTMQTFLVRHGYPQPLTIDKTLRYLQKSFSAGIPHEVGMFLGYPVKDVKGFMELRSEPSKERGLWRIYGPPARSLKLSNLYSSKKKEMIMRLSTGCAPYRLLQAV